MGCNCKWTEIIIAIVVFICVMWPNFLGAVASKWVAGIAAIALFIHALMCKNCGKCMPEMKSMPSRKPATTKKKRR